MTVNSAQAVRHLADLPLADRRDALTAIVVAEFKAVLFFPDEEELPLSESYFELGFTSLRITEVKERLEERLGCRLSTTLLFNSPTVAQLLDHLVTEVFPEVFGAGPAATRDAGAQPQWSGVLDDLFRP